MRLDKFISNNTEFSRSDAKRLVHARRIKINNTVAQASDIKIKDNSDHITIDDKTITAIGKIYLMLNKPEGYVCANCDPKHPTVLDLLRDSSNAKGEPIPPLPYKDLQIVGRLDVDTTGLVLITNNGKWNHAITSSKSQCLKVYRASLDSPLKEDIALSFSQGVYLKGEAKKTRPATVEIISPKQARLSISEGKYHQVKRMFAAMGNHVCALHRESIAGLTLDKTLVSGQFRLLRAAELDIVRKNIYPGAT